MNQLLLTVLGFVVGLALSFRSSTAYERYNDGRKYWAQLAFQSQNLARLIWIHVDERHEKDAELGKQDLLAKINCLNLIAAYAVALKHKLRFEPGVHYDDLKHLVGHLDTFARDADQPEANKPGIFKTAGQFLGLPMAESNPRKLLKRSRVPLGNLPLEILNHLSVYMKSIYENGTFKVSIYQTQSLNALTSFNDVLAGTERILSTPLPLAYSIAISQIVSVPVRTACEAYTDFIRLPLDLGVYPSSALPTIQAPGIHHDPRKRLCSLHYPRHRAHRSRD